MMIGTDLNTVLPELILAIYSMAALMFSVYFGKDKRAKAVFWMTAIVMVVLAAMIAVAPAGSHTAFSGAFVDDEFSRYLKVLSLLASAAIILLSIDYLQKINLLKFEYPILIALATVGMMMMVSAGETRFCL